MEIQTIDFVCYLVAAFASGCGITAAVVAYFILRALGNVGYAEDKA